MNTILNVSRWTSVNPRIAMTQETGNSPADALFDVKLLPTGSLFDSVGVVLDLSAVAQAAASVAARPHTAPAQPAPTPLSTYTASAAAASLNASAPAPQSAQTLDVLA